MVSKKISMGKNVMKKVIVVGLGLVSGSIVKLIREKLGDQITIVGVARRKETLNLAKDYIDEGYTDIKDANFKDSDLVIIGLPIKLTMDYIPQIAEKVGNDTIITDISSVKGDIMKAAELSKDNFIGGHPLAGSEKKGFENADAKIMAGAKYVLTPFDEGDNLKKLKSFLESLSFDVQVMSGEEHDRQVASISHLPYFIAAGLLNSVKYRDLSLAATGFASATRIASTDPLWGQEIACYNKDAILYSLEMFEKSIRELRYKIDTDKDVSEYLQNAKKLREDTLTGK